MMVSCSSLGAPLRTSVEYSSFAPASLPKLLVSVMVDGPSTGSIFGGTVAAPAWKKITEFALGYLKIPPA